VIGKTLIGWYLGRTDLGATWGQAAASTLSILVWIYYTTMIVLLGAELTEAWATAYGQGIAPAEGAERVVKQKRVVPETRRGPQAGPQSLAGV